jgi:F420 biosynthesis protein FbiB-like protein
MDNLDSSALHQFLRTRRSVRRFESRPVDRTALTEILQTSITAPSAHNRQPWRYTVIETPAVKEKLASAMGYEFRHDLTRDGFSPEEVEARVKRSYQRITEAPVVIILSTDLSAGDEYTDNDRAMADYTMLVQDATLAGGTLLLAAHAEGLGGVWMCSPLFAQATVRHELGLPDHWEPITMILLGHPAKTPEPPARKTLDDVVKFL